MLPGVDNVRVVVFGGFAGARYRAGRTVRFLRRHFTAVFDASVLNPEKLAESLRHPCQFIWLLRAGAWPAHIEHWHAPVSNASRPLCAFGAVNFPRIAPQAHALLRRCLREKISTLESEIQKWSALHAETSGDLSKLENAPDRIPTVASALLDARLAPVIAQHIEAGLGVNEALTRAISAQPARLVRLAQLDVSDDPALRCAQAVTSLQRGGAERVALDLAGELPRYGVRPIFFALGAPMRAAFEAPESLVEIPRGKNRAEHVENFCRQAIHQACDLVHAHLLSAGDMVQISNHALPAMATVHNLRQGWPQGFEQIRGVQLLASCAQAVEQDLLKANAAVPVRTVWNGIAAAEYAPSVESISAGKLLCERLESAANDFVVLALANPRPQKRLERLPAVMAALNAEFIVHGIERRAVLLVAGEASRAGSGLESAQKLRDEIARLKLEDSIRLIGAVEDVPALLAASDVLVSVSEWEGLSLAHLEALAAGVPVVATDAGGTREIARENSSLRLVPLDAPAERVASEITSIALKNINRLENADGDRFKRSNFTLDKMTQRYSSLYPRVCEAARGQRRGEGIWLVANNFSTGGAQSSARRLLTGLKTRGVSVRAAVLQERSSNLTPGLRALRESGVPVFVAEPNSPDPLDAVMQILEQIDTDPPRSILFWNVIAEHKILIADALTDIPIYDVSPGEMCFDSLKTYFARPRPGLPYINGTEYGARLGGVIVKYQREAERAQRMLGCKVHVIPNGLPLNEWPEFNGREHPRNDGRIVIGTSARISAQKKLEELIEALRLAKDNLPPHVLQIAGGIETGSEEYAVRLKRLCAGLNVEWVGEFQHSRDFLSQLDIFAMISEPAGCPNASLEAMAAGLPLIATDHGGASEQVVDGVTGRLVPRRDAVSLASALIKLANDPATREAFGRAGREHVAKRFSLERMISDYARLCL